MRNYVISTIAILFFSDLCFQQVLFAQQKKQAPDLGNWTMFFGQGRFNEKIGLHAEAQFRDYGIQNQPEQFLFRTGAVYHLNASTHVILGYAYIANYPFDDYWLQEPVVSENRIWQQLSLKNKIGCFHIEHRYRLEQRWLEMSNSTRYRDRARYLMRVIAPLNNKNIERNTWFVHFYNELFIHFSREAFDRNRLYGSFGYQLSEKTNIQAGYLAQTVNMTTKSYIQLAFNYTLDLRNKAKK